MNLNIKGILTNISSPIRVVVRNDDSGTSSILSSAFSSFDPFRSSSSPPSLYDSSFANTVSSASSPKWCGSNATDEVQILQITGCDSSLTFDNKMITIYVISKSFTIVPINFTCDIPSNDLMNLLSNAMGGQMYVSLTSLGVYTIGYLASVQSTSIVSGVSISTPLNWYQPYIVSFSNSISNVKISTLQEGGGVNNNFKYVKPSSLSIPQVQSLWIDTSTGALSTSYSVNISFFNNSQSMIGLPCLYMTNPLAFNTTIIKSSLNTCSGGLINTVTLVPHGTLLEYRLTFVQIVGGPTLTSQFRVNNSSIYTFISLLTSSQNQPIYYSNIGSGSSGAGLWTCYKREHNYTSWSYNTGQLNAGVLAEVF